MPDADILKSVLGRYFHVEAQEMIEKLGPQIRAGRFSPEWIAQFRQELSSTIAGRGLSPAEYKDITRDNECPDREALAEKMRDVWAYVFTDEPPPA